VKYEDTSKARELKAESTVLNAARASLEVQLLDNSVGCRTSKQTCIQGNLVGRDRETTEF
jgi:hypothetical protein